jgi:O-methyltransferase domain
VLHDWDDPHAARILTALGQSATNHTRLRIFEMLLPEDAAPHRAKMSDVLMLLMFDGARERTVGQYRDLLEGTGWQLERVVPSPGPMSVLQASRSATSQQLGRANVPDLAERNQAPTEAASRFVKAEPVGDRGRLPATGDPELGQDP